MQQYSQKMSTITCLPQMPVCSMLCLVALSRAKFGVKAMVNI